MVGIDFPYREALSAGWQDFACRLPRLIRGGLCFALLLTLARPHDLAAQFKFREPPNRQLPSALDRDGGERLWQQFLQARRDIRFRMEGGLVHRPSDSASTSYALTLQADWGPDFEETRILLRLPSGESLEQTIRARVDVAELEYMEALSGDWRPLGEIALGQAIFPSLPLTWQDLMMPFLKWEPVTYLGPRRTIGRPAQAFRLSNPVKDVSPAFVDVVLDEDFAALLEATFHSHDGTLLKRLRVTGFKEFPSGWLFSGLVWEDRADRSSTRLEVQHFALLPPF